MLPFTSWIKVKLPIIEIKMFAKSNVSLGSGRAKKGLEILLAEGP